MEIVIVMATPAPSGVFCLWVWGSRFGLNMKKVSLLLLFIPLLCWWSCEEEHEDCAGVAGGSAEYDDCGVCNGDNSTCKDCDGEINGLAYENECGCVGGNTGYDPDFCFGCTDCNATNFNPDALIDDDSCILLNTNRLGTYSVQDSVHGPFFDMFYDDYLIQIVQDACDSIGISINNYANITNSLGELNVIAQIVGDSVYVPYQIIEVPGQDLITDYMTIFESTGYFKEDSIFLTLYYMDMFDPYFGHLWGKKD